MDKCHPPSPQDTFAKPSKRTRPFLQPHAHTGVHTAADFSLFLHLCLHVQSCMSSQGPVQICMRPIRDMNHSMASSQSGRSLSARELGWRPDSGPQMGLQLPEAERCGASCSLATGAAWASFLLYRLCSFILHPCPLPHPSLLPPEEVQLEGDRARSSAGADRTKVNMPAIAAASSLWTDDGRWAGEDHTHEAPWTTQAPACLPACATRLHAEAYMGCFHIIHGVPQPHRCWETHF